MIKLSEPQSSLSLMPDMTALLDVIFILLVFMMLTANVAPRLLEVDLPVAAVPASQVEANAITLGLSEQGEYSIDRTPYADWTTFQAALVQSIASKRDQYQSEPQLLVAADKHVALEPFVKLASWLSEQGLAVAEVVVSDQVE